VVTVRGADSVGNHRGQEGDDLLEGPAADGRDASVKEGSVRSRGVENVDPVLEPACHEGNPPLGPVAEGRVGVADGGDKGHQPDDDFVRVERREVLLDRLDKAQEFGLGNPGEEILMAGGKLGGQDIQVAHPVFGGQGGEGGGLARRRGE
jgi:hypothetical protein